MERHPGRHPERPQGRTGAKAQALLTLKPVSPAGPGDARSEFASDLINLTLASPSVNSHQKSDKDAAEWLPDLNQCWYVDRIIRVRLEYTITIDRAQADAPATLTHHFRVGATITPTAEPYRKRPDPSEDA